MYKEDYETNERRITNMIKFEVCSSYDPNVVKIPVRATEFSAGYDFYNLNYTVTVPPHGTAMIKTGIKAQMDPNMVLLMFIRSSLAFKHGLQLTNSVGVIDADYYNNPDNEGEIGISLYNMNDTYVKIDPYERIAQGIFMPYFLTYNDISNAKRAGGFGSTGA
jgi:dUTP pyrophosphatase